MSTRNWNILENYAGFQPILDVSSVQQHAIGATCHAKHATYGVGKFIYGRGVASTAAGDLCMYDNYNTTTHADGTVLNGRTVRCVAATRGPVGVAMGANIADKFGWYQIEGAGVVNAGTVAAQGQVFSTATAGTVDDAVVAGSWVVGATFKTADGTPSAGKAVVALSNPVMCGVPA